MSAITEQAASERAKSLLATLGMPKIGKFHMVREDDTATLNVDIDTDFEPSSAVIMLNKRTNEHYYDADGHEVFCH